MLKRHLRLYLKYKGSAGTYSLELNPEVAMVVSFPGAFDTGSATEDMLEKKKGMIFEWLLPAAVLTKVEQVLVADDTGASNATINIEIGGTEALSSDLTLSETESTGTIDTANDDVATGDRVEITWVTNGSNADGQRVHPFRGKEDGHEPPRRRSCRAHGLS